RPDAILHAQFFAEDGVVFYRDAYQSGLHSLFLTYGGYFHTLLRLTALFAQLFPFAWAPLTMNLIGITMQVLPVNVFVSSRFSHIPLRLRLLASFIYLALPNSFEIDANATNLQWHQALLGCVLLLGQPALTRAWKCFDGAALLLASLSSPMGILLAAVAGAMWWKRRQGWWRVSLGVLSSGAPIQLVSIVRHWNARQVPHRDLWGHLIFNGGPRGASLHYFAAILGRQVFFSSIFGLNAQKWLLVHYLFFVDLVLCAGGLFFLLYALRNGPAELKFFIAFAGAVFALGVMNPLAGTPDHPQWYWLCYPGCGNRYYFFPMLAFLASLLWLANSKLSACVLRYSATGLLLLLPAGIALDWQYPAFYNLRFQQFAAGFEHAPAGTTFRLPVNPGWLMELKKH
ncbi:MAG: hypothetical protein JO356_01720, partial [Acidobacteria bacterium]|nr:hypothetical protein [Acidobacteriota bacterium]